MNFVSFLKTYVGQEVEVVFPNTMVEGTLSSVQTSVLQVQVPPTIYGGGQTATIPLSSIDYVRILV